MCGCLWGVTLQLVSRIPPQEKKETFPPRKIKGGDHSLVWCVIGGVSRLKHGSILREHSEWTKPSLCLFQIRENNRFEISFCDQLSARPFNYGCCASYEVSRRRFCVHLCGRTNRNWHVFHVIRQPMIQNRTTIIPDAWIQHSLVDRETATTKTSEPTWARAVAGQGLRPIY